MRDGYNGHFHQGHHESLDGMLFTMLDIMEIAELASSRAAPSRVASQQSHAVRHCRQWPQTCRSLRRSALLAERCRCRLVLNDKNFYHGLFAIDVINDDAENIVGIDLSDVL